MVQILADTKLCTSAAGYRIFGFVGHILNFIFIAVPIIIILMATIDLVKAVVAQKEDEIKKAQSTVMKRAIVGVVIFFVPIIVRLLMSMVGGETTNQCFTCVLNTPSECVEKGTQMNKNQGGFGEGTNTLPEENPSQELLSNAGA